MAQRASYLAMHSFLFRPLVQLIMIILSLTALNLCSVLPMVHTLTNVSHFFPCFKTYQKPCTLVYGVYDQLNYYLKNVINTISHHPFMTIGIYLILQQRVFCLILIRVSLVLDSFCVVWDAEVVLWKAQILNVR